MKKNLDTSGWKSKPLKRLKRAMNKKARKKGTNNSDYNKLRDISKILS